ncbi:D-alanyl-D-alanine carboxypeptidase [Dyella solisilvae]|uniref:D-alanyl-D-alanine carboxypeptidase n=1 Tax=Dyella solisilvae TaxID=1920168 RepID=A0A370K6Y1_9GAMM|nr:D-alanyl-D-alanine carboxypeptidase family protein [Dyella solisilvae]RDI98408.1 D-alanyl-D-alanine carboxypeptidase [Dyella solisilvae]
MAIKSKTAGRALPWLRSLMAVLALCGAGSLMGVAHAATGYGAIVINEADGQVITAVNPDEQNHPASLAKMMTLYLTFQALEGGKLKLDQELPVSAWAASKAPTKLDLRNGQTISVEDCILGMITKSANDAATVMAEGLGGTEGDFVESMNAQALRLGMSNTHFANASGLPDPNDTTTARDMAKLAMALYHDYPQYSHYFATKEFMFRGRLVRGHNNLMDKYPGMDGLKTGFTNASGFNLASTAVRDGQRIFGVVMGGHTAATRDRLMARLLDDGFEDHETPAALVAQAAGTPAGASRTKRVLEALSPIGTAEAETVPETARRHHRHGKVGTVAATTCTPRKGAKCPTSAKRSAAKKPLASASSRSIPKEP